MTKPRDLANSVNSASIPGTRLENDAITASKMAPNSVDSSELANDAVSTSKIQNAAVTTAKLAGGPAFRAGEGTQASVPNAVWTKITFGTEQLDTANCYASDRFTPNVAGLYQINAAVQYNGATSSSALFGFAIYKNGGAHSDGNGNITLQYAGTAGGDLVQLNGTTDYVEIYALHSEGNAQNMVGKYFSGCWLRP